MSYKEERSKRTAWMMNDRLGLFIHWGLYAIPAIGEWKQSYERIDTKDYKKYFYEFITSGAS